MGVTFGLARPGGLNLLSIAVSIGGTLLFLVLSATIGRRVVAWLVRWSNDQLLSEFSTITVMLAVMGTLALVTDGIGINTVLGAFVAGVLMGQSPILTRHVDAELRGVVIALFAPIFFGLAGLGTDLTLLKDPVLLALTAGLILIASLGKFGGAFLGGRIGGLSRAECLALALGMNARGSTEVIVASIGLSIGALNGTLFTMIGTRAVVTTTAMPPTLRWALARLPIGKDEAERLEREAFDETAFLSKVERLLLAVDGGASGRLASRLAGLLGGSRQLPVTLMPIDRMSGVEQPTKEVLAERKAVVEGAYRAAHATPENEDKTEVDVTERPSTPKAVEEAVGTEARKGYGLLVIGMEPATAPEGGLHPDLSKMVGSFSGARAVVVARGLHIAKPDDGPLRLLVPATGTDASRRAAEVAFSLARAEGGKVSVMFVADPPAVGSRSGRRDRAAKAERMQADVLTDMTEIAKRYEVEIETLVRVSDDKDAAILGQARRAGDTLIVLGVSPRWSERVPFGALAGSLLEGSQHSLLLVVNQSSIGVTEPAKG